METNNLNMENASGDHLKVEDITHEDENSDVKKHSDEWLDVLGNQKLTKKVLQKGNGFSTRPAHGSIVSIRTRGHLEDGTEVDVNENLSFALGEGNVITAFDLAVALMELHETALLKTEAKYAYGAVGRHPDIPPNAAITYDLELLRVDPAIDIESLPLSERIKLGNQKRERGNILYTRNEFHSCIDSYNRALKILEAESNADNDDVNLIRELNEIKLKCYNNMAAAQLKLNAYDAALQSCHYVLENDQNNVKALFRTGKALAAKHLVADAIGILRRALKLDPESKVIHQELKRLINKQKVNEDVERDLYRRMIYGKGDKKTSGLSWWRSKWTVFGGAAVALAASLGFAYLLHGHRA